MNYTVGQKVYFQRHPRDEDEAWYRGVIVEKTPLMQIYSPNNYRVKLENNWRHFFIPATRLLPRED